MSDQMAFALDPMDDDVMPLRDQLRIASPREARRMERAYRRGYQQGFWMALAHLSHQGIEGIEPCVFGSAIHAWRFDIESVERVVRTRDFHPEEPPGFRDYLRGRRPFPWCQHGGRS